MREAGSNDPPERPRVPWEELVPRIEPLVYQVRAGDSLGTAFAISVAGSEDGGSYAMLVTAWHVVKDIVQTADPLDLVQSDGTLVSTLTTGPVSVYPVGPPECDSALVVVPTEKALVAPSQLLPIPLETMLPRGAQVGWLGYPGLVYPELCFFRGVVSGHQEEPPIYLIDGVAINGVSGGPAFDRTGLLAGFVSAYVPNQVDHGTTLPGLMIMTPLNLVRLWVEEIFGARIITR